MKNNPTYDLYIDESTDYFVVAELVNIEEATDGSPDTETPLDLTEVVSVRADIRKDFDLDSPILLSFSAEVVAPAENGEISLVLSKTQLTGLNLANAPVVLFGYYDLVTENTVGVTTKIIGGRVFINRTVTR